MKNQTLHVFGIEQKPSILEIQLACSKAYEVIISLKLKNNKSFFYKHLVIWGFNATDTYRKLVFH